MAGVRDPQFWKRFSVAVHMDEEHGEQKSDVKHRFVLPIYFPALQKPRLTYSSATPG